MAYRAEKCGFAAEAQCKIMGKYDPNAAAKCMEWIASAPVLGDDSILVPDGNPDKFHEVLCDGVVLARLANWVEEKSIAEKQMKPSKMAFKRMELIGQFLNVMKDKEIVETPSLFQTVDLYEKQNLSQVVLCIQAIGSEMLTRGRPGFGVAKSKGTKKDWTQEQLNAGKGIIGLQMGTNKGASQAGQNFGKSRSIMD